MDFDFLSESLKKYLEKTSLKSPVPGGGSVIALVASLSCCLLDMVINFTLGKEKYKEYESDFQKIKERNEEIKGFIEEDSKIYKMIVENKNNKEKQEEYFKKSIEIHKKICDYMKEVIEFSNFAAKYGNKYLISDAGIVALLGISAFKGAKLNIFINFKYLSEKEGYVKILEELEKDEKRIERKGEKIYQYTSNKIGGQHG